MGLPAWYETAEDGRQVAVLRGSAYGGCVRAVSAALAGFEPLPFDDASVQRMEEGNLHEPDIIRRMQKESDWEPLGRDQHEVELWIGSSIVIRGHLDEVVQHKVTGEMRVLECKALGTSTWQKYTNSGLREFPTYQWQVSAYGHALGMGAVYAVKHRDSGELLVDALDALPYTRSECQQRAALIVAHASAIEQGDGMPDCDRGQTWFCDYRYLHEKQRREPVEGIELADGEAERLRQLMADHVRLSVIEKEARKRRKEIGDEILPLFKDVGDDDKGARVEVDGYYATRVRQVRRYYDTDAMREDGIDVDAYQRETVSIFPKVGARKEKG